MPDGNGGRSVVSRSGIPEKELKGIVRMVSREFGSFPQSARLMHAPQGACRVYCCQALS